MHGGAQLKHWSPRDRDAIPYARDEDYQKPCPEALLFQSYKFNTLYVV